MTSISVLGGGISGLSAAFHLARRFPPASGARLTLVERGDRLGGWIRAERVRVEDTRGHRADVVLESGPRTLRPHSNAILELVNLLDLSASVVSVSRDSPAARNRFLHIPGTKGLETIPNSIPALLRSPLAKVLVPAVCRDLVRSPKRAPSASSDSDESVDSFLTRQFGPKFAQIFGSALVHGIYATDSRLLSTHAAFPMLRRLEETGGGSVVRGAFVEMLTAIRSNGKADASDNYDLGTIPQLMKGVSVYSFRDGMQTLSEAMAKYLHDQANVEVITSDAVSVMGRNAGKQGYEVTLASGRRITSTHLISAMPLPGLHQILASSSSTTRTPPSDALPSLPHLLANPTSSVTVVNLVFPPSATPIHPPGFGYLIPRPATGYRPSSSLGMLGTVFDSCALSAQDVDLTPCSTDSGTFTKVTVMLGGPHGSPSPAPSSAEFLPTLLTTLQTQLGRAESLPTPCAVRVREHHACIPTPTVGHHARMAELEAAVREKWGPNAAVIGAGVGGVSVGDCVESGRRAALTLQV